MEEMLTIGHSTRSIEEFLALLSRYGVEQLIDVRTIPRSRHNPQFNRESLPASLLEFHIGYAHVKNLGGLRKPLPESLNEGWRNLSFRGFADYMGTADFRDGLDQLLKISQGQKVAIMCAEAVPWRCHRSLIADAVQVRGQPVKHILTMERLDTHRLTPWAKVEGDRITYPKSP